jgi:methylthioribose-1-phosphate isomerase
MGAAPVTALRYRRGVVELIDQRLLPGDTVWIAGTDVEVVARAIETMVVRGAPAIGCAAAFGLAVDAVRFADERRLDGARWSDYAERFARASERLARTRPTAVNLFYAINRMRGLAGTFAAAMPIAAVVDALEALASELFDHDVATCRAIGSAGATLAEGRRLRVLTHCNTGSLATAGYGTALGVVRALHERGELEIVYADETRPWLQGARLTAYELATEGIPYKLIADSTAAYLMQQSQIDLVVVGADRIAANGDTANKIGTYGLAVQCKHHGVPFYVAAPLSTFDAKIATGAGIPVEERGADEVRTAGGRLVAPADAPVYNPSFDVTPAALISGLITEAGVLVPPFTATIGEALRGRSS